MKNWRSNLSARGTLTYLLRIMYSVWTHGWPYGNTHEAGTPYEVRGSFIRCTQYQKWILFFAEYIAGTCPRHEIVYFSYFSLFLSPGKEISGYNVTIGAHLVIRTRDLQKQSKL